jgi:hypothetical protein
MYSFDKSHVKTSAVTAVLKVLTIPCFSVLFAIRPGITRPTTLVSGNKSPAKENPVEKKL